VIVVNRLDHDLTSPVFALTQVMPHASTTSEVAARGLVLDGVSRSVDQELHLADVSLSFAPGSFTTLLGRTRAGKTSLLRVLAGLDRPSAGTLHWHGVDVTRADVRTRDVAMVYQQFVNYPSLTVYDNIASPLRVKRVAKPELDRRVRETASLLRLDGLLQRLPAELSGGQQQRTAIARALVKRAGLVLLDEPLANLDYKLREELRRELRGLLRSSEAAVVYATAEPNEALLLGATTVVLDEGRVLQRGDALRVYRAPASTRVAQVFSDPQLNLFAAELRDGKLRLGGALSVDLPEDCTELAPGPYQLGLRANHLRLTRASGRDVCVPAAVLALEISGSETLLHASTPDFKLSALMSGAHRFTLGSAVELYFAPDDLLMFDRAGSLLARRRDTSVLASAHGTP